MLSGQNILEVKNLSVAFGGDKVIENLSFNLKEKENLVIVGPNGAGKSVLLKCLLGILPYTGEVKWSREVKIGYVPQKFLPEKSLPLSVEEFFKFNKVNGRSMGDHAIHEALCSVGIHDSESIMKKRMGVLSSGQLQRLLIAWGMLGNPDVLFFDEPTAGIDIGGEETIYNLLAKLEKERDLTMVLITHDLNVVYKFADSVLCLNKKAVCYGSPKDAITVENLHKLYGEEMSYYKHGH